MEQKFRTFLEKIHRNLYQSIPSDELLHHFNNWILSRYDEQTRHLNIYSTKEK